MGPWRNYYRPPESAKKEKVFGLTLKSAVKDAIETVLIAILSTAAAIAIFAITIGPVVGFAVLGWWPLAVLWGVCSAICWTVIAQSGPQLSWAWKRDHGRD